MKRTLLTLFTLFSLGSAVYASTNTTDYNSGAGSTTGNMPKTGVSPQQGNMPTTPGIVNPLPGTTVPNPQLTPGNSNNPTINNNPGTNTAPGTNSNTSN